MTFEDHFDGTGLNPAFWTVKGLPNDDRYHPDHVSVSGGNLLLKIARISGQVYGARIDSDQKFAQRYGYFECRVQIPPTEKTLFAFWMSK